MAQISHVDSVVVHDLCDTLAVDGKDLEVVQHVDEFCDDVGFQVLTSF